MLRQRNTIRVIRIKITCSVDLPGNKIMCTQQSLAPRPAKLTYKPYLLLAFSTLMSVASIQTVNAASNPATVSLISTISMLLLDKCTDSDKDTLCDIDEIRYFGDIDSVNDASADEDGDNLSNGLEMNTLHSDPTSTNTDGDALGDYAEFLIGTNLTIAFDDGATLGKNTPVDRAQMHKLNRLTFGPTQVELDQVNALGGIDNWIADQLIPIGLPPPPPPDISAVAPLYGGDDDVYPLPYDCTNHVTPDPAQAIRDCYVARNSTDADIFSSIRLVHSTRQLQTRMAMFWDNHFNTFLNAHNRGMQELYDEDNWFVNAFGNFKVLLELNAKNYTMLEYLDLDDNLKGNPNENFAREVMELHSVGIDGGYTDTDIAQLAYILTGWDHSDVRNISGLCDDRTLIDSCRPFVSRYGSRGRANNDNGQGGVPPTGLDASAVYAPLRIFSFISNDHDDGLVDWDNDGTINTTKTLSWPYKGTTYSTTITSQAGANGVLEGGEALDFLVTHTATADFICMKLAQEFVSDIPQTLTLANCASTFLANSEASNQMGLVLANLLGSTEFNDPSNQRTKLKDTQEVMLNLARLLGWDAAHRSDAVPFHQSIAYKIEDAEQPIFLKSEPTGYYETADNWLDTSIVLNRFREMNSMVFDEDQTQSFVSYFNALGMTSSGEIMTHLFLLMLGGNYNEHDVQLAVNWLHRVEPNDAIDLRLQAFSLANVDAEDRLLALIARLVALPEFHLH